jgi:hypothetical protein
MSASRRAVIRLVGPVSIPILVGVAMAAKWPHAGGDFYSSIVQVIATLFVAIAVEFFAREASATGRMEGVRLVLLVGESWAGVFGCVRALAGSGTAVTAGLAGTGVTAAAVLLALALYEEIRKHGDGSDRVELIAGGVLLLFLFGPVLILTLG